MLRLGHVLARNSAVVLLSRWERGGCPPMGPPRKHREEWVQWDRGAARR